MPETREALLKSSSNRNVKKVETDKLGQPESMESVDYVDFSSDDDTNEITVTSCSAEMSWLLEKCLSNLGGIFIEKKVNAERWKKNNSKFLNWYLFRYWIYRCQLRLN